MLIATPYALNPVSALETGFLAGRKNPVSKAETGLRVKFLNQ